MKVEKLDVCFYCWCKEMEKIPDHKLLLFAKYFEQQGKSDKPCITHKMNRVMQK